MIDSEGRETVTVKKDELLDILNKNRADHRATFERALSGWQRKVTSVLAAAYEDAKAGRKFENRIYIERPSDQTKDYDRVIKMVEMSVADTVTLTKEHFAQYVMDDWRWKEQFTTSTMAYMKE